MTDFSPLQRARLQYQPQLPRELDSMTSLGFVEKDEVTYEKAVEPLFPNLSKASTLDLCHKPSPNRALKVGVVLSGGQAAGGHNVISGILDALQKLHPESRLIGFLNGPAGIIKNQYLEITQDLVANYRNQGGFDIIGSGRTKIETQEQFAASLTAAQAHDLDGLIVIGGDDSNTNAAFLAEYFLANGCKTCVAGVPKTIDGDLQNEAIEISFGFDTACKVYSETIGNIARDALSAKKYYYFIKLMGRSASHITLECAMQTQVNLALIAEEIDEKKWTLADCTAQIVTLIQERYSQGKQYGLIVIPEGIIEFMPDIKALIRYLNQFLASTAVHAKELDKLSSGDDKIAYAIRFLPETVKMTFTQLPREIQLQLLLDRDPHGNVQVSKIETERLFIQMAAVELKRLGIPFAAQPIFCGYEGRSCLPSNFDCNYCYALGQLAALVVAREHTGYIVSFGNLRKPASDWQAKVTSLLSMLHLEEREGKKKAVIEKALVDLKGNAFTTFVKERDKWRTSDAYIQPGPIQFFGPHELTDTVPVTLR